MIPAEAVEAAAKAAFAKWHPEKEWAANPAIQEMFRRDARLHLEAAAPHMTSSEGGE